MRNLIMLLFGGFILLLAAACSKPAPPTLQSAPVNYCYQEHRCSPVQDSISAPAKQRMRVSQMATSTKQVVAPSPRFYTRWRRVHGRWYQFTFRKGRRRVSLKRSKMKTKSVVEANANSATDFIEKNLVKYI